MIDYLLALGSSLSLPEIWKRHCDEMESFGFDRLIYAFTRYREDALHGELEDALVLSNHPAEYIQRFVAEKMFLDAPLAPWVRNSDGGAVSWHSVRANPSKLTEKQRKVLEYNVSMDVTAGYTLRFLDPNPRVLGLISMAARKDVTQDSVEEIWAKDGARIEAMNQMFHLKVLSLPHSVERAPLSARQREVLEWIGEGKSNQNIATILGVSLPTVEKHLRLAREKLGVETTAQAVLKATFLNQIYVV